jgi:DNA-binding MarR family transcriptional regulator
MKFDEIIKSISKEVVDEKDNIEQVVLTLLSSYTDNPQNLRILAPSGEGKTHTVLKTAKYFPQENIWKISEASSKSFRYLAQTKVIETDEGFKDFEEVIQPYVEQLNDKSKRAESKKEIKKLEKQAYFLLDFTNVTIIFLDSQSYALWESLKTTLSHDDVIRKDITTNKINGSNQIQKTAYKGYPAVIYCSAKDEISQDETDEMNTRFNTVSIKGSSKKYKKILDLVLQNDDPTYEIISPKEIEEAKINVKEIIDNIESYHGVFNPFIQNIADNFPCDKGSRARQLKILSNTIKMLTLSKSENRFSLVKDDVQFLISSKSDVIDAIQIIREPNPIAATKIQFFNEKIRTFFVERLDSAIASEIAEYLKMDRKKLLENYLVPFIDHGYLEKERDPTNKSRDVYSIAPRYEKEVASIFSTLIDASTIDISCLKNSLECRLQQGYKIVNSKGSVVSLETIVDVQGEIVTPSSMIMPKTNDVDMSNNVDES